MKILCTLQNLHLSFPHKTIFEGIDFTLRATEKIGVLGLNGHGKSSFLKVLAEKITPDSSIPAFSYDKSSDYSYFYVPQELEYDEETLVEDYYAFFYPQFYQLKKKLKNIEHQLNQGLGEMNSLLEQQSDIYQKLDDLGENEIYSKFINYLKSFGLDYQGKKMKNLSGGEQRKVGLALGLSAPSEVILWDEPTNHLDYESILSFEQELRVSKKTFLIISHDRELLSQVVDRIVHIQNGGLEDFKGSYQDYLQFLRDKEQQRQQEVAKLSNTHRRELAWMRQGVKARATRSKKRVENFHDLNEKIQQLKSRAHQKVELSLEHTQRKAKILLELKEVALKFSDQALFEGVSLRLTKGEKVALLGKNGAGKSSFLKLLLKELPPSSGEVKTLEGLSVGYFSQKRELLDLEKTPWQLIGDGQDFIVQENGDKKHVVSYLESFLFSRDECMRPISTLSGGERNRLQLALFMKYPRDLWIFDEPTNDLDLETIGIIEQELQNYKGALIIVCHDRAFIDALAQKCWLIDEGKFHQFEAGPREVELYYDEKYLREKEQKDSIKEQERNNQKSDKKKNNSSGFKIEELELQIEKVEQELLLLDQQLSTLDYSRTDQAFLTELQELEVNKQRLIDQQEELYNKLEQDL